MLNPSQIEQVRMLLQSSAWGEVMKPILKTREQGAITALVLPLEKRTGDFKGMDDSRLRARIEEARWMLSYWELEVMAHDHNRRRDELDRQRQNGAHTVAANP